MLFISFSAVSESARARHEIATSCFPELFGKLFGTSMSSDSPELLCLRAARSVLPEKSSSYFSPFYFIYIYIYICIYMITKFQIEHWDVNSNAKVS